MFTAFIFISLFSLFNLSFRSFLLYQAVLDSLSVTCYTKDDRDADKARKSCDIWFFHSRDS